MTSVIREFNFSITLYIMKNAGSFMFQLRLLCHKFRLMHTTFEAHTYVTLPISETRKTSVQVPQMKPALMLANTESSLAVLVNL
jgi:hypothetical protein